VPPGKRPFFGQRVFIQGELSGYSAAAENEMRYNDSLGVYEGKLYLKQGFYNYRYVTLPEPNKNNSVLSASATEGDFWGTENQYLLLLYFRPFGARADELIGATELRSNFMR
jgi:hypothetical protein